MKGDRDTNAEAPFYVLLGGNHVVAGVRTGGTDYPMYIDVLHDVRVWNIARKGAEISATYQSQLLGPQPGLVANWHFDATSGARAVDSSGDHHDATLSAGAAFSLEVHP